MEQSKSRLTRVFHLLLKDWERRLTLLFVGLFVLQFIRWFAAEEGGWLPLTVQATTYSILFVFAVMLPIRMPAWLRFSLQFIGVLCINALAVNYQFISYKLDSWKQFISFLKENVHQLHPYFWFILGIWLTYIFIFWLVKVKWRIVLFVLVSVVAIAVRDSFSVNYLWSQTAMMIFCGLCLLVIHHFATLKRKNPSSWAYISEYPGALALPVVLILGLTMLLGSLAPDVSNLLTDPYTLYKSWKGEVVEKIVKKNGTYASGSAASSGNSSSGYSRNDEIIGGGFDYDYSPVMTVDSSKRSYWRGETHSNYTGTGWKESDKQTNFATDGDASDTDLPHDPRIDISKLKTVDVTQTFTFQNDIQYPVLFGAFSIHSVASINGEKPSPNSLLWVFSKNEMRLRNNKQAVPKVYTLHSKVPIIDATGLRAITTPPANIAELAEFLELPPSLPSRVTELAKTITATATTQYDKVKAIEEYLQTTYPYTNKPNLKLGTSKDFVDRFLFEIKEGYCDYFSTAMAVLTRSIGVPSRWVKGYTAGTSSQDEAKQRGNIPDGAVPDSDGADVFSVRNSNAHSWVEVYFEGYGWLPFEATSGFVIPRVLPEGEKAPELDVESAPALAKENADKPLLGTRGKLLISGGILVGLAVLYVLLRTRIKIWYRRFSILKRRKQRKASNLNEQVVHEFTRLLRYLRRKGISTEEHETARETFFRISDRKGWMKKEFETILSLFEKAKYSGKSITAEELRQVNSIFKRLRQEL